MADGACSRARGRGKQGDRLKVRASGTDYIQVGSAGADLRLVEQLVDAEQVDALAQMIRLCFEDNLLVINTIQDIVRILLERIDEKGFDALDAHGTAGCGLALPRPQEIAACLNRLRIGKPDEAARRA